MSASCTVRGCTYPLSAFHCGKGGCHRTFIQLSDFDAHRLGHVDSRYCENPLRVGLIPEDGLWSTTEGHMTRQKRVAQMNRARGAKKGDA